MTERAYLRSIKLDDPRVDRALEEMRGLTKQPTPASENNATILAEGLKDDIDDPDD